MYLMISGPWRKGKTAFETVFEMKTRCLPAGLHPKSNQKYVLIIE